MKMLLKKINLWKSFTTYTPPPFKWWEKWHAVGLVPRWFVGEEGFFLILFWPRFNLGQMRKMTPPSFHDGENGGLCQFLIYHWTCGFETMPCSILPAETAKKMAWSGGEGGHIWENPWWRGNYMVLTTSRSTQTQVHKSEVWITRVPHDQNKHWHDNSKPWSKSNVSKSRRLLSTWCSRSLDLWILDKASTR